MLDFSIAGLASWSLNAENSPKLGNSFYVKRCLFTSWENGGGLGMDVKGIKRSELDKIHDTQWYTNTNRSVIPIHTYTILEMFIYSVE